MSPFAFNRLIWMKQMRERDQLSYYERREREQQERADHASLAAHRDFHAHLAQHYGRLKQEMLSLRVGPTLS